MTEQVSEKQHKKAIRAWAMYDWANSVFVTSITATILPIYYASVAAGNLSPNLRTAYWGYTSTIALLIVSILGPILGAMADFSGAKKRFLATFVLIGAAGTSFLYFTQTGDWILASLIYIVGNLGFSGSIVFYDSLLPHIARNDEIDQVSTRGYAMGYLGGGLLLAINLGMVMFLPGLLAKAPQIPTERVSNGMITLNQSELLLLRSKDIKDLTSLSSLPESAWQQVTRLDPEIMSTGEGLTKEEWLKITGETEQEWQKGFNGAYTPITSLSQARWDTITSISKEELTKLSISLKAEEWSQVMRLAEKSNWSGLMTRLSFLTVAVWWVVFTIPLLKNVSEPKRRIAAGEKGFNPIKASISRLLKTFREIGKYKELAKFVVAFWLYYNGIGTIITMASIYGAELHFSQTVIIGTLLMVQFVAIPFSFLFGWLPKKIGTKPAILLALGVYTLIAIGGYFLATEVHFVLLGLGVASVQGGSQALSRSLFGRMVPKSKSAEFFSFFSISEKLSGVLGPLVFAVVSQLLGGSRLSIVSLVIFFIAGAALLISVKVKEGIRVAEEDETAIVQEDAAAVS